MTSEICVMNKNGLALAADSATTFENNQKIYNSANKLFKFNEHIGIMVFGNADFNGTPWETIIKVFTKKYSQQPYTILENSISDFLNYLSTTEAFFNQNTEFEIFLKLIDESLMEFFSQDDIVETLINENIDIVANAAFQKFLNKHIDLLHKQKTIITKKNLFKKLKREFFPFLKQHTLQKGNQFYFELTEATLEKFFLYVYLLFIKEPLSPSNLSSGIVFAGFGEDEYFPCCQTIYISGSLYNELKFILGSFINIGNNNGESSAAIIPFAQSDMVNTFMLGMDPFMMEQLPYQLDRMLNSHFDEIGLHDLRTKKIIDSSMLVKNITNDLVDLIYDLGQSLNRDPILDTVKNLPKEELANMAETLVNLTSFKRKVSNEIQNVGGPIDVALITKGDGFVWVNQK